VNQRIHSWPYRKIINKIKYKEELAGIELKDNIDEGIVQELITLVAGFLFQSKASRFIPLLLRLKNASGYKRGTQSLRKSFPGISYEGE
jgi:hypothetical protein